MSIMSIDVYNCINVLTAKKSGLISYSRFLFSFDVVKFSAVSRESTSQPSASSSNRNAAKKQAPPPALSAASPARITWAKSVRDGAGDR